MVGYFPTKIFWNPESLKENPLTSFSISLTINFKPDRTLESESDRNVESLRLSASNLLSTFRAKLERLQGNETITNLYLRQGYDSRRCNEVATKFFGSSTVNYLAVDGTKFEEPRLDMLVFYSGSYAYRGTTRFLDNGDILSEVPSTAADYYSISSAIPLSEEYSSAVFGEKGESGIEFDPGKVSSSIMRLSEYYMVYQALGADPNLKIVLMDRTVSGDIAHTSWKLREYVQDGACKLTGLETNFGKISTLDLELGRMLLESIGLKIPAPRSQFLGFAAMAFLLDTKQLLTAIQIANKIGAKEGRESKIQKELTSNLFGQAFVNQEAGAFQVREDMRNYWKRLLEATLKMTDHIFNPPKDGHPLKMKDLPSGGEIWLSWQDIDYLSLILITAILKECWQRNVMLLGIVKDSAANELVKTVIPILQFSRLVKKDMNDVERFESDTMLLQANSIVNSSMLSCPWRTFEYDVCFRTISPIKKSDETTLRKGECRVNGAYKNVIASERLFVKSYFQLWESENDPTLRSHVFLYDRPCYPQYDMVQELRLINRDGDVDEEIVPALHFLSDSPLGDLTLAILDSMGREPIPEALGHNYPLFLADKRAKVAFEEAASSCVAAVDLEIAKSRLDQQILFQGKYRQMRSDVEAIRRKSRKQTKK